MPRAIVLLTVLAISTACSKEVSPGSTSSTSGTPAAGETAPAIPTPAPGTFKVDGLHSNVLFKAQHASAGYLYGWFRDVSGTFAIDADPQKSHIEVTVKAASLDTRDEERNASLTGPDFLNATQFPELSFKSTKVEPSGSGWTVTGDLAIHGVTRSVTFKAIPVGDAKDPEGMRRVGLEAHLTIQRADFGVTFMPEMVSPGIELVIALEGVVA